jgi:hypothetical protein
MEEKIVEAVEERGMSDGNNTVTTLQQHCNNTVTTR